MTDFCFSTCEATLRFGLKEPREPQGKPVQAGGKERQSVLHKLVFRAQGSNLSQRAIRSDSATVWSPPLNVGNCINQHISPKAESIYSTARLLAIIRPPATIVFAPHVLSPASQGKGRGKIRAMMFCVQAQYLRGLGPSANGHSGLEPPLLSPSSAFVLHCEGVSLHAGCHFTFHVSVLPTSPSPCK